MKYHKKKGQNNKKKARKGNQPKQESVINGATDLKISHDKPGPGTSLELQQVLHDINDAIVTLDEAAPYELEESSSNSVILRTFKLPPQPIEWFDEGKDFYEGNSIVIHPSGEVIYFAAIEEDVIFLEYEQTFHATQRIVVAAPSYHRYEIFLLLYPMMAMAYMQMILADQLERATAFLERAATHLDGSYTRRIAKLRRIRRPEELPERALELLASADTVEVAMAFPTYYLYINCVADWTLGQQKKLLSHFAIRSYDDVDSHQDWMLPGQPQPEPIVHSSVVLPPYWPLDRSQQPTIFMFAPDDPAAIIRCSTISDDLSMVALGTNRHYVLVTMNVDKIRLESVSRKREATLHGHKGPVLSVAFAPYDRFLLSCSQDRTMRLWCVISWNCVSVYPSQQCNYVTFAPRGFVFATASEDGVARVWGHNTKQPLLQLAGHLADMAVCQFHANRQYLATGSADCTVRMWDIHRGVQVRLFRGHRENITALAYSMCGRYLISGAHDARVIVWDTVSGRMIHTLEYHTDVIHVIAVDMENNTLAVGGATALSFWDFQLLVNQSSSDGADAADDADDADIDAESSPKLSAKELLYSSYANLEAPLSCIRFVSRNLMMAVSTEPLAVAGTTIKDEVIVTEEWAEGE